MYSGEATSDAKGASDPGAGAMVWSGAHRVNASSDEVSAFDAASHGAAMVGPDMYCGYARSDAVSAMDGALSTSTRILSRIGQHKHWGQGPLFFGEDVRPMPPMLVLPNPAYDQLACCELSAPPSMLADQV